MSITIRESGCYEAKLEKIFTNKTAGADMSIKGYIAIRDFTLAELKGTFTKNELTALLQMQNGSIFDPAFAASKNAFLAGLEDAENLESLSNIYNFDYNNLVTKIKNFTSAQIYFLVERINTFWEKNENLEDMLEYFKVYSYIITSGNIYIEGATPFDDCKELNEKYDSVQLAMDVAETFTKMDMKDGDRLYINMEQGEKISYAGFTWDGEKWSE